jgi:hypothetical protein
MAAALRHRPEAAVIWSILGQNLDVALHYIVAGDG